MHVLLTNDDGPLDDKACPYLKYLVDEIVTNTDWDLSIVVPNQQRSWIGKAHFAEKTLSAELLYTKVSTSEKNPEINSFEGPFNSPQEDKRINPLYQEWCLIDSTPAACADIGIHHAYPEKGPVDFVLSGPNFGQNSSNLYILALGTVGAAMEAVTHGLKSVAISYSFTSLDHDFNQIKEAAKISVKLTKRLLKELNESSDIDLYLVNIPLCPSLKLGQSKIHYAPIHQTQWGSIYASVSEKDSIGRTQFEWAPDFKTVYKNSLTDHSHSDSRVLLDEGISVTPLKASFSEVLKSGEIILDDDEESASSKFEASLYLTTPKDSYVDNPVRSGFLRSFSGDIYSEIPKSGPVFHYGDYEDLDIDNIHRKDYYVCSYIYRKALIRKHYLANTVKHFVAKNPALILAKAVPESFQIEVDYAEFLDDALDEVYELRQELEQGGKNWIVKPSMSDKGQGIRVFRTIEQLQNIFDEFDEESDEEEEAKEEKGGEKSDKVESSKKKNGIILSQLRHFIVQEYKDSPLLLPQYDNKKFHLRVYVVASGDLKVYVYKKVLTLFAGSKFVKPGVNDDEATEIPIEGHLTNTCLQEDDIPLVVGFNELEGIEISKKQTILNQVYEVTGEVFKAATSVDKMNFQPLSNGCEIYGVDFLVDESFEVTLLEVNAYPDFKQTGDELKELIDGLFVEYFGVVRELMGGKKYDGEGLELVLDQKSHGW